MKTKAFTLVELLVVIAIITMLMGILMPALAKARAVAYHIVCGSNLSGIGKAILIYANDYEDKFPQAGGKSSTLGPVAKWDAADQYQAYGMQPDGSGGRASVTGCYYLLVKLAEVTPKSFICKSDTYTSEFKPSLYGRTKELIDLWDFGPTNSSRDQFPQKHCSYVYHQPLHSLPAMTYSCALTTLSEPGMAVAADWNPWMPRVRESIGGDWNKFDPAGTPEAQKEGNTVPHQKDGQNVLFLDSHVCFEKRAYCGIEEDNIYTYWAGTTPNWEKRKGLVRTAIGFRPQDRTDSFLINDSSLKWMCFPADTLVWVNGELVKISTISTNQSAGRLCNITPIPFAKEIEKVEEHQGVFDCYDIILENAESISVADNHFFLLDSDQWVSVQELTRCLRLQSLNGPVAIKSVVKRAMPLVGKVYNLKVKASDRYFVGKDGVIVRDY